METERFFKLAGRTHLSGPISPEQADALFQILMDAAELIGAQVSGGFEETDENGVPLIPEEAPNV